MLHGSIFWGYRTSFRRSGSPPRAYLKPVEDSMRGGVPRKQRDV
jgi:hypothetical protein